ACPRLHKLAVINCERTTDAGIRSFVSDFGVRTCASLQIVWKRARSHPAAFFLDLVNEHRALLDGLRSRFISKKFPNDSSGERIVVWNKERKKALFIQDYSPSEQHRILGFAVPFHSDDTDLDDRIIAQLSASEDAKQPVATAQEEAVAVQSVLEADLHTK
uniref:Uncharacterized protein n=1 Tax=Plectus sambesii TaxID=2011161 RepID=A0A914UWY9_9BILA